MATKAKTQVERRREYVKEHPEEKDALAELQATTRPVLKQMQAAMRPQASVDEVASPVADYNAPEAIELIAGSTDATELQAIVDGDTRKTVKEAAQKRLAEL